VSVAVTSLSFRRSTSERVGPTTKTPTFLRRTNRCVVVAGVNDNDVAGVDDVRARDVAAADRRRLCRFPLLDYEAPGEQSDDVVDLGDVPKKYPLVPETLGTKPLNFLKRS